MAEFVNREHGKPRDVKQRKSENGSFQSRSHAAPMRFSLSRYSIRSIHSGGQASNPRWAPTKAPVMAAMESLSPLVTAAADGGMAAGIIGVQQKTEHGGGEGFFGDPAGAQFIARIAVARHGGQGDVDAVEHGQAIIPPAGNEFLRRAHFRTKPDLAEPILVINGSLRFAVISKPLREFTDIAA